MHQEKEWEKGKGVFITYSGATTCYWNTLEKSQIPSVSFNGLKMCIKLSLSCLSTCFVVIYMSAMTSRLPTESGWGKLLEQHNIKAPALKKHIPTLAIALVPVCSQSRGSGVCIAPAIVTDAVHTSFNVISQIWVFSLAPCRK